MVMVELRGSWESLEQRGERRVSEAKRGILADFRG